jgi:putative restriction endonuclease
MPASGRASIVRSLLDLGELLLADWCRLRDVLIASHAKAWSQASNRERLNPYDGVLLTAWVDRLFDKGVKDALTSAPSVIHLS